MESSDTSVRRRRRFPDRRTAPAGVSRLRQRGRGHRRLAGDLGSQKRPAGSIAWSSCWLRTPVPAGSESATPVGPPTAPQPTSTPIPTRRRRRGGRGPQRGDRELPVPSGTAEAEGYCLPLGHRHRGHRAPGRRLPEASRVDGGGGSSDYGPLVAAVQAALSQLQGTYGLAILFRDYPDVMIAARLGSPLIVGRRRGRALRRQRRVAAGRAHRQDRLSGRSRDGRASRPTRCA